MTLAQQKIERRLLRHEAIDYFDRSYGGSIRMA